MEVTALCIRLLVDVFVLLAAQVDHSYSAQKADAVFLHVNPNRLQFSEYESFSVTCEGTDGVSEWRVMRKLQKVLEVNSSSNTCNQLEPSCTFDPAFEIDSGKYWCENEDGGTSDTINIIVAGSVMLEIPQQPVMEGDDVILRCINKTTKSKDTVNFYKDGVYLETRYDNMIYTIQNISKTNEGFYKCGIPGYAESPEMWLAVQKQKTEPPEDTDLSYSDVPETTMLWIVGVLLVALLLLLMGALLCSKHKVCISSGKLSPGRDDNMVLREDNVTDQHHATYAVVNKQRKSNGGDKADDPNHMTYASVTKPKPAASRAATRPQEESIIYSSVSINTQVMRATNEPRRKEDNVIYSSVNRK